MLSPPVKYDMSNGSRRISHTALESRVNTVLTIIVVFLTSCSI